MIQLEIDSTKVISFALVPVMLDDNLLMMSKDVPVADRADADKIKIMIQMQILRREDLTVIESAMLTPNELKKYCHLARAIGMSVEAAATAVDGNLEEYKKLVRSRGGDL